MTLMLLTALVDRLMVPATWFLQYLNAKLGHLYQPFNIRVFHLLTIAAILVIFFFLVPAAIFNVMEPDWNYLDSIYYCFISLTTIGLGDYIPGDAPSQPLRPLYKIATTGTTSYWHRSWSSNAKIHFTFNSLPADRSGVYGTDFDRLLRDPAAECRKRLPTQIGWIHGQPVLLRGYRKIPAAGDVCRGPAVVGFKRSVSSSIWHLRSVEQTSHLLVPMIQFSSCLPGGNYGATEEEAARSSRQIVRVKSRREEDSPSPEDTTPVHARP